MKRFLTCTAAAALLAAPAHAFDKDDYEMGYSSGIAVAYCIHYAQNKISHSDFLMGMRQARKRVEPWMADILITSFQVGAKDSERSPAVRRAFRKCHNASKHLESVRPAYGSKI